MTVYYSDAARTNLVDALITTAYGASPRIRIYDGTVPADEAASIGASTMLVEWATCSWGAASPAGVRAFTGTAAATAAAFGATNKTATYYRVYKSDGTTCVEQGSVGVSGTDMTIDNTSIAQNQTVNLTSFTKTAPG